MFLINTSLLFILALYSGENFFCAAASTIEVHLTSLKKDVTQENTGFFKVELDRLKTDHN